MRPTARLFIIVSCLLAALSSSSQEKSSFDRYEVSLLSGYNSPLGFFGMKVGYKPIFCKGKIQFDAGIGITNLQSRISLGANVFLFKERMLTPYFGLDYAVGMPGSKLDKPGGDVYKIGVSDYLDPYFGLRIRLNTFFAIKLKSGYSFLLNNPEIYAPGTTNTVVPSELTDGVKGGPLFIVGFSISFNEFVKVKNAD
jgi:hypothetical protein